jgi:hypothetical protein
MDIRPKHGIFGLPPSTYVSDDLMLASLPVVEINPCKPYFDAGLNLFQLTDDWDRFHKILKNQGFSIGQNLIRVAFLADNFPTDTFTNDYGDTFLQKFTDVASSGMQELAQMTGSQTGLQGLAKTAKGLQAAGEAIGGPIGSIVSAGGGGAADIAGGLDKFVKNQAIQGGVLAGGAQLVNKLAGGHRVDFPMIWRNSGFAPSYTMTVRLYNPNPKSDAATEKYILGPLAVLLTLALPYSDDGATFNYPFFHRMDVEGLWYLDPAVITNITVIKGGDQQQIAYNQKLSMVDVRIDVASLYTTMMVEENASDVPSRPTLKKYLDNLRVGRSVKTRKQMVDGTASKMLGGGDLINLHYKEEERQRLLEERRNETLKNLASTAPGEIRPRSSTLPTETALMKRLTGLYA